MFVNRPVVIGLGQRAGFGVGVGFRELRGFVLASRDFRLGGGVV